MYWPFKINKTAIAILAAIAMVMVHFSGTLSSPTDATTGATGMSGSYSAPPDAEALYQRARIYMKQGNHSAALMRLQKAVEADPSFAEAHYLRGRVLIKLKKKDEAVRALGRAISLKPRDKRLLGGALYTRGALLLGMGNPGKALDDLTKAIDLLPGYALIHIKRARAYKALGEFQKALEDMEHAVELKPEHAIDLKDELTVLRALTNSSR